MIAQGTDYAHIEERLDEVGRHNAQAMRSSDVIIACGMATYEGDDCVAAVFGRADRHMYEDKLNLKSRERDKDMVGPRA